MSDFFLGLVSTYGTIIIALSTFLSCLALPIPASFVMLAGGAFVASGDLSAIPVVAAAFLGAVAGDQVGFRVGRLGGHRIETWLNRSPTRAVALARARALVTRWGVTGVFFSRWLVSPLGPWVNLIAGATGMAAARFTIAGAAGEAVWVGLYVGLGFLFAANLGALSYVLGNTVAAVTAAAVALGLGALLLANARRRAA
jgi:membrane protein DedA with SNARE-associated domain